jgi:hypothetical protein
MIEQVVVVVVGAFALFVLYRFRDFIFSTVLGGVVALVMRPSRTEQARNLAEHDRHERIREDFRALSDTMLEHSVRYGRGNPQYPYAEKLATIRQMVGRLEHESPELSGPLHQISRHFDQNLNVTPEEARQLLHPLNNQVRDLLAQSAHGRRKK